MANPDLLKKLADVPLARPGFDALNVTAPVMVQMNPDGKWENKKPDSLDEKQLQAVVQHLVNSEALSATQTCCCQCTAEAKGASGGAVSKYVPVIMMPIYPADKCPFNLNCEIQKLKENETKPAKKGKARDAKPSGKESHVNADKKKTKKRGFVMQRLTDFDLMSQW